MAGYQTCIVGRFGNNGPRDAEGFLIFVLTRSKRCNPSAPEEHLFEDDPGWLLPFEDDNFAALLVLKLQMRNHVPLVALYQLPAGSRGATLRS